MPETITLENGKTATLVDGWFENHDGFFTLKGAIPVMTDVIRDTLISKDIDFVDFQENNDIVFVVSHRGLKWFMNFRKLYNIKEM